MLINKFNIKILRRLFIFGILLFIFLFSAIKYYKTINKTNEPLVKNDTQIIVKTTKTSPQKIETGFYSFGRIEPTKISEIVSEVTSKVLERYVQEGTFVKKDQKILNIERRDTDFTLQSSAKNLEKQKLNFESNKKLYEQGLISKKEYLQSNEDYEQSKANFEKTKALNKSYDVLAPFDSYVEKIYPKQGEMVFAGQTKLIKFLSNGDFYLISNIPEEKRRLIAKGSQAEIIIENYTKQTNDQTLNEQNTNQPDEIKINGFVEILSNISDQLSRTFDVKILIDKNDPNYKQISNYLTTNSGITLKIFLKTGTKQAFFIPSSALVISKDGSIGVYIVNSQDVAIFKQVEIAKTTNDGIFVLIKKSQDKTSDSSLINEELNIVTSGGGYCEDGLVVKHSEG